MKYDGLPKMMLSLSILGLTCLSANLSVTRMTPDAHVYQIQLLGHIMMVCPETFQKSGDNIDCDRWIRRTRGGNTVFVQPSLLPPEPKTTTLLSELPMPAVAEELANESSVSYSPRPQPRVGRALD